MVALGTDSVRARETAWLQSSGDGLPALLATAGGPFDIIQAGWPGAHFARNKRGVYVLRRRIGTPRSGGVRIRPFHPMWLKVCWPVLKTTPGIAEGEQQALDDAVELALQRINGLPFVKTHGGRFLSAGETQIPPVSYVEVDFQDPEVTIPAGQWLRADILYGIDDLEVID